MVERYQNKDQLVSSLLIMKAIDTSHAGDNHRVMIRNHSAQRFAHRWRLCDSYDSTATITTQSLEHRKQSKITSKLLPIAKVWRQK